MKRMFGTLVIAAMFIAVVITGCAGMYTQQNLEASAMLNPGMTKEQVRSVMGMPVKAEFSGRLSAWHYCRTGYSSDEFVVLVFVDDELAKSHSYGVTLSDTGGATGDCAKFIRPYNFEAADNIEEIRIRLLPDH
jgi:hypothetical protein